MAPSPPASTLPPSFLFSLLPVEGFLSSLLFLWIISELLFLLYYRLVLLPRANDPLDDCDDCGGGNKDKCDDDETSSRLRRRLKRPTSRPFPAPYRDYDHPHSGGGGGGGRHKLMLRIMERIERTCAATGQDVRAASAEFINGWFRSEVEGVSVEDLLSATQAGNEVEVGTDKEVRTKKEEEEEAG
eukprot:CAMPEP_0197433976 /NCGR_PEP_ID=MMETSP1175-20131217/1774_1 /TAXON_ID=1003142 /ORGANISM="Triceratium dubium, Strain CCMP147" /LENGTH=185 /DNA_ID=CAMNT_0042962531 /DNA_START=46 /DNA_END=599 /DNA_ORIENTATION=+